MSAGFMCTCQRPPLHGLVKSDRGHAVRPGGKTGCPNYSADQQRGGLCAFCADAALLESRSVPAPRQSPYDDMDGIVVADEASDAGSRR